MPWFGARALFLQNDEQFKNFKQSRRSEKIVWRPNIPGERTVGIEKFVFFSTGWATTQTGLKKIWTSLELEHVLNYYNNLYGTLMKFNINKIKVLHFIG